MWLSSLLGFPLPFILLVIFAFGSLVCSHIISADEQQQNTLQGTIAVVKNRMSTSQQEPEYQQSILTKSKSFMAFITNSHCNKNNIMEFLISKQYRYKSNKIKSQATRYPTEKTIPNHYTLPSTSLEDLRRRFGTATFWGDLNAHETRLFYKQQLPKALQIDGALGLSLEERATIASANRHVLRMYARERCHLPARVIARVYDGLRHLYIFGTWNSDGMTWDEVKQKYSDEARKLGYTSEEEILLFVYNRIVDRSSVTNSFFDDIAKSLMDGSMDSNKAVFLLWKSILDSPKLESPKSSSSKDIDFGKFTIPSDVVLKISKLPASIRSTLPKLFTL